MAPLQPGAVAPTVPGVTFGEGPVGLFFYKVTCPTCRLVAPKMRFFERAFPGRMVGVGQDPEPDLEAFRSEYAMAIRTVEDAPPYPVSVAYDIVSVPTLFLVSEDGRIRESLAAWDRTAFNRVAEVMAGLTGADPVVISSPDDGLPDFKPG
jgi:hypothetical protein